MSINASLVEDIISLEELREEMRSVVQGLQEEMGKNVNIRTSPGQWQDPCAPPWLLNMACLVH